MGIKKKNNSFIKRLYNFIISDIKDVIKSVRWDNIGNKYGFYIINSELFHKRCKKKSITLSSNYKSLIRQFHKYGFKNVNNFWYHYNYKFYKNSKFLNCIKPRYNVHIKKKKLSDKSIESKGFYKFKNNILESTKNFLKIEKEMNIKNFPNNYFELNDDELTILKESDLLF